MNRWFMASDIHGGAYAIMSFIERNLELNFTSDDKMILTGDTGANYYCDARDKRFKNELAAMPFTYYLVRGNHERRPSELMEMHPDDWEMIYDDAVGGDVIVEKQYPTIRYFKDEPSIYTIEGYKTLVMGGAYSVDKYYRLQSGYNWFETEQMTKEEKALVFKLCEQNNYEFDLVLTHTCPACFEPTDLFIPGLDQSTVDKSMEEFFGELEYKIDYKAWIWGHFHAYRPYPMRDGKKQLMLYSFDMVELTDFMCTDEYPNKL